MRPRSARVAGASPGSAVHRTSLVRVSRSARNQARQPRAVEPPLALHAGDVAAEVVVGVELARRSGRDAGRAVTSPPKPKSVTSRTPQLGHVRRKDIGGDRIQIRSNAARGRCVCTESILRTRAMAIGTQRGRSSTGARTRPSSWRRSRTASTPLDGAVGIATLLVGEDYAAQVYQRRIDRHAHEAGIFSRPERLPARRLARRACSRCSTSSTATRACRGILVLRPLPPHLPEADVLRALPRLKDVEAQHPENAGLLALGTPRFTPSTAGGGVPHARPLHGVGRAATRRSPTTGSTSSSSAARPTSASRPRSSGSRATRP